VKWLSAFFLKEKGAFYSYPEFLRNKLTPLL